MTDNTEGRALPEPGFTLSVYNQPDEHFYTAAQLRAHAAAEVARIREVCLAYEKARNAYGLAEEFYGEEENCKEMREARKNVRLAVKPYRAFLNAARAKEPT